MPLPPSTLETATHTLSSHDKEEEEEEEGWMLWLQNCSS
jgi:hypothetical protein